MQPKSDKTTEVAGEHPPAKEWRRPKLQKLPIAATGQAAKPGGNSNDGGAPGKGEVATPAS
jgi:hypothetical protein